MTTTIVFRVPQNAKPVIMPGRALLTNVILLVVLVKVYPSIAALHVPLDIIE